jgi:hypothetical protein
VFNHIITKKIVYFCFKEDFGDGIEMILDYAEKVAKIK